MKPPKPRSHVIVFQRRFVPLIESLEKTHTIRPPRKREIFAGDTLRLRHWEGLPYRTPQAEFMVTQCTRVEPVTICGSCVILPDRRRLSEQKITGTLRLCRFARRDGFPDWEAMREWFHVNHGVTGINPFRGILIHWQD